MSDWGEHAGTNEIAYALELARLHYADDYLLMERLLTTGSLAARGRAAAIIRTNDKPSQILASYAQVSVIDEAGLGDSDQGRDGYNNEADLFFMLVSGHVLKERADALGTSKEAETYWRGLMAYSLVGLEIPAEGEITMRDDEQDQRISAFIQWAGEHSDVRSVIETASERQTLNIDDLQSVLSDKALGAGAL